MKLLLDSLEEYLIYRKLAAQGKTDSEIHDALFDSNSCIDVEIMFHVDLPPIAYRLAHSSTRITLETYARMNTEQERLGRESIGAKLR